MRPVRICPTGRAPPCLRCTTPALRAAHPRRGLPARVRYGKFCGHVSLPAGVDDRDVTATYANGVLELSLGLEDDHASRTIKVEKRPVEGP